ncbi:SART-1 family protein DOT2-like protein [Drosera capensis]
MELIVISHPVHPFPLGCLLPPNALMVMELSKSRRERSEEQYRSRTPVGDPLEGAIDNDNGRRESSKHRSKDTKKSRRDEKDHKSRDKEYLKSTDGFREKEVKDSRKELMSSRGKTKEGKEEPEKDSSSRDKEREKYRGRDQEKDRDRRVRGIARDSERSEEVELDIDQGQGYERSKDRSRTRDKERNWDMSKDRDRTKYRERDKERQTDRDKQREHEKDRDGVRLDMEKGKQKAKEEKHDTFGIVSKEEQVGMQENFGPSDENAEKLQVGKHREGTSDGQDENKGKVEERILKMKEERLRKKSEGGSEILSWVSKSRKIEEKRNAEKLKAIQLSRIFDEQDNIGEDIDQDIGDQQSADALAGVKVLHGLDKVIEGGSVVLTLKDQQILANGDINDDVEMLENIEIGEQNRRDEAYKAAKKKTGIYDDKFNDKPGLEKKILPQYDDPADDEGVALDAHGRFTGAAEKKLEELRKRLLGVSVINQVEDLNSSVKIASDYYTHEEMLQFKKPKKKKSLRRKDKLDVDALEAEAISAGLGMEDLGSRSDTKRERAREKEDRSEAEMRNNAYQSAYAKADEASRALRMEQAGVVRTEDDTPFFVDDAEDLEISLERARKLALKKQSEDATNGPEAIARIASSIATREPTDIHLPASGESVENKVVFTEMEEFVWGLQLDEETSKPSDENVFMEEDEMPTAIEEVARGVAGDWTEVIDSATDAQSKNEHVVEIVPDKTIHEAPVGKGLSGALKLLQERGSLKEGPGLGGRNMDKKKSKLVGIYDEEGPKQISIERTDEYGRILTPKEAFRLLSHKFHGKAPGKMKLEKRQKQYHDELKLKQMKNSDTPSQSVERMREAQARLKTPYLVLSGHVKPGQSGDSSSGFATVEKEVPGSLTPMLGDKKFLFCHCKACPYRPSLTDTSFGQDRVVRNTNRPVGIDDDNRHNGDSSDEEDKQIVNTRAIGTEETLQSGHTTKKKVQWVQTSQKRSKHMHYSSSIVEPT